MTNQNIFLFVSVACLMVSLSVNGMFIKVSRTLGDGIKKLTFYKTGEDGVSKGGAVCQATINYSYDIKGWDIITVETFSNGNTDSHQAECAGEIEGELTTFQIYDYYYNNIKSYCEGRKAACKKVKAFLRTHLKWLENHVNDNSDSDIWHQAGLFLAQVKGMYTGYDSSKASSEYKITMEEFMMMNFQFDLDDVFDALEGDISAKVKGNTRCSALIKLLAGNKDLIAGHTTWTTYNQMNRMLKSYNFRFKTNANSTVIIPGWKTSFSGYPAVISSGDDFYSSVTNLVAMETTIGNSNASLWSYVKPTGQLFESMRSVIAMRLAENGKSWSKIFSQYNSGTYNNQWMILDYNKFQKGKSPKKGTLYILEQIPGHVRFADQTKVLKKQSYWPSYNTPFYKDIFNLSGNQALVDEYGDWFSYDKTPRAEIFRRDHTTVVDNTTMLALIRSNNYKNDKYAKCNCTPPYSAENAISARSDLNPADGTYPFSALGHRCHGAIDAKVISSENMNDFTFTAVSGPTTGTDLPVFDWRSSDCKKLPHMGLLNTTDFMPFIVQWPSAP